MGWLDVNAKNTEEMNTQQTQEIMSFLVHLREPNPKIKLYLQGLHNTLTVHRPNRNVEGWRIPNAKREEVDGAYADRGFTDDYTEQVLSEPQLKWDIEDPERLFALEKQVWESYGNPKELERAIVEVIHLVVDANLRSTT